MLKKYPEFLIRPIDYEIFIHLGDGKYTRNGDRNNEDPHVSEYEFLISNNFFECAKNKLAKIKVLRNHYKNWHKEWVTETSSGELVESRSFSEYVFNKSGIILDTFLRNINIMYKIPEIELYWKLRKLFYLGIESKSAENKKEILNNFIEENF